MRLAIIRCSVVAVVLLSAAGSAFGRSRAEWSVEWLARSADVLAIGRIRQVTHLPGPGDVTYERCVVELGQVFKGDLRGRRLTLVIRRMHLPSVRPLTESKEGVLLFLSWSTHEWEKPMDRVWVPAGDMRGLMVFDLTNPPEKLYSKDMRAVVTWEEVFDIVLRWGAAPVKHSVLWEVPPGTPGLPAYHASAFYLVVPAEEKHRLHFMDLARSPKQYEREKAAEELRKFPGAETEAVLRRLLEDDTQRPVHRDHHELNGIEYPVRKAAFYTLVAMGKPVPGVALRRMPTPQERREHRARTWCNSFREALKGGWDVSVEDAATRDVKDASGHRQEALVVVTCRREGQEGRFTIVPTSWPAADMRDAEYLGVYGARTDRARRFCLKGEFPDDLKQRIVRYFPLKK